jgi:hypothetical protein
MIEKRLRQFRKPHCGSVRIDETYVKIRGKWRYLYRAIDKHGNPIDFLLTAKRDRDAAKRFFRKMLKDEPLLSPEKIGTDGANTFPSGVVREDSVAGEFTRPRWADDLPDNRQTLDECIASYTTEAAFAEFTETWKGRLPVGYAPTWSCLIPIWMGALRTTSRPRKSPTPFAAEG